MIYTDTKNTVVTIWLGVVLLMLIPVSGFATTTSFWQQSDASNSKSIEHQQWQQILDKYLIANHSSGVNRFDYAKVTAADKKVLKMYLSGLEKIDPRDYQRAQQKAYWINFYNALTVALILDNYPVKSIKKLGKGLFSFGPWDDELTNVAGQSLSLNDIEHKILRPIWQDPRIHYAVNCASYGCPNLAAKAFTPANMEALLEQGAGAYINHQRGVGFKGGKLIVSSIFHWYADDFGGSDKMLIKHLKQYAKPALKQQLDAYQGAIDHGYDWRLNAP